MIRSEYYSYRVSVGSQSVVISVVYDLEGICGGSDDSPSSAVSNSRVQFSFWMESNMISEPMVQLGRIMMIRRLLVDPCAGSLVLKVPLSMWRLGGMFHCR